jgi:hypothetical protein
MPWQQLRDREMRNIGKDDGLGKRLQRADSYAPKTKRVPTAERITLLGISARTRS